MSGLPWFRLYAEFATDPVVQSLAFEDQRHFVMLLCLKCSGVLDKRYDQPDARDGVLRKALGLAADTFADAMDRLMSMGILDADFQPINWEKRQFVSDHDRTAAERKRRERARHAHVTRDNSASHGQVTEVSLRSDTDTDTDTDSEKNKKQSKRALRASRLVPDDFSPDLEYARKQLPDINAELEAQHFKDCEFKTPKTDWNRAWRNWIRTCKDRGQYARGSKAAGMEGVQWR